MHYNIYGAIYSHFSPTCFGSYFGNLQGDFQTKLPRFVQMHMFVKKNLNSQFTFFFIQCGIIKNTKVQKD